MQPNRFIPAGAGNTPARPNKGALVTVYPRWRGEHGRWSNSQSEQSGLSPLARGTHQWSAADEFALRFIPAGAGNTRMLMRVSAIYSVYPRWRGEHHGNFTADVLALGLSPLARGTQADRKTVFSQRRFIPAGAGNTLKLYICSKSPFLPHNKLPTVR